MESVREKLLLVLYQKSKMSIKAHSCNLRLQMLAKFSRLRTMTDTLHFKSMVMQLNATKSGINSSSYQW